MSSSVFAIVDGLRYVVGSAIFVFSAFRAIEMGRGFVDPIYRSRAYWSAALFLVAVGSNVSNYVTYPNDVLGFIIGFLPFPILLFTVLAFVDRSVLVAITTDFFHRDILKWKRARKVAFALFAFSFVSLITGAFFISNGGNFPTTGDPVILIIAYYQFVVILPGVLAYGAAALFVGVRRTPDNNLKGNIRFLAFALALFVLDLIVGSITNDSPPFDLIDDALSLAATYLLYRSVMSLTVLGRVRTPPETSPGLSQQTLTH